MYFSCQHLNFLFFFAFLFQVDYLNSVLLTRFVLSFLFVWKHIFCFFTLCVLLHDVRMEWVLHWKHILHKVNGSIIKDQIGVLSVSVSQPAPQGHLVANQGTAWPCSEGCCYHHTGGSLVLSDSSRHCFFFFLTHIFCATAPWWY